MIRKWTSEQKAEIVSHNIDLAKAVVYEAERVNKGALAHTINADMSCLKLLLRKNRNLKFSSDGFKRLCRLRVALSANLYLLEKGLK